VGKNRGHHSHQKETVFKQYHLHGGGKYGANLSKGGREERDLGPKNWTRHKEEHKGLKRRDPLGGILNPLPGCWVKGNPTHLHERKERRRDAFIRKDGTKTAEWHRGGKKKKQELKGSLLVGGGGGLVWGGGLPSRSKKGMM